MLPVERGSKHDITQPNPNPAIFDSLRVCSLDIRQRQMKRETVPSSIR